MIIHAGDSAVRWQELDEAGVFCAKLYALYEMYGCTGGPFDMWLLYGGDLGGKAAGAVWALGSAFTICAGENAGYEEAAAFLKMRAAGSVTGRLEQIERLARYLPGTVEGSFIWQAGGGSGRETARGDFAVRPAARLSDVYELLRRVRPGFAESVPYPLWLTEMSHKRRHGLGQTYVLEVDGAAVSTISIMFQNSKTAVLGMGATRPDMRSRGYGAAVGSYASREAARSGRRCYAIAERDSLGAYYEAFGCVRAGRWACLLPRGENNNQEVTDGATIF